MPQFSELTVTIKDDEKTLKKKFPIYDSYQVSYQDPVVNNCIEEVLKNFSGDPDSIRVRINMQVE